MDFGIRCPRPGWNTPNAQSIPYPPSPSRLRRAAWIMVWDVLGNLAVRGYSITLQFCHAIAQLQGLLTWATLHLHPSLAALICFLAESEDIFKRRPHVSEAGNALGQISRNRELCDRKMLVRGSVDLDAPEIHSGNPYDTCLAFEHAEELRRVRYPFLVAWAKERSPDAM
jgi:hypothetical protein